MGLKPQTVFGTLSVREDPGQSNIVRVCDLRITLLYLTILSLFLLTLHVILPYSPLKNIYHHFYHVEDFSDINDDDDVFDIGVIRSLEIYTEKIHALRLVGCLVLLSFAAYFIRQEDNIGQINTLLLVTYIYATALSLGTVLTKGRWRDITSRHLSSIFFGGFCVYSYRDLLPLAVQERSMDLRDGWIGTVRLSLLLLCGVLVPLLLPQSYVPVDPENPQTPNTQQTASWLSKATFSYVDPIIYHAYKRTDINMSDLPTLADNDRSRYLVKTAFPLVDPIQLSNKRHIFFGLVRYYKWKYVMMCGLLSLQVVNDFAAPVATLKLLGYLEAESKEGLVQPWVWILWLTFGPAIASICAQAFLYMSTIVYVQMEAIFTQLVFEHSLRIRVNSHTSNASSKPTSNISSPANGSATDSITGGDDVTTAHVPGSNISDATTVADELDLSGGEAMKAANKMEDQTGKLMTLLSTDLKNIQWGQDWMLPPFFLVRVIICSVFLYKLLGWSALVGIGFLILTLPVPALVAKLLMTVQEEKMRKVGGVALVAVLWSECIVQTDARIQIINQVMNVLRMVKLFAWESKMEMQITEKRDLELKYIRNSELIDIGNGALNSLLPLATMMVVYATYTLSMKKELTASVVFPSAAVFALFRNVIFQAFWEIPMILRAKVSLDRFGEYLHGGELFESPVHIEYTTASASPSKPDAPYFRDAVFTWTKPGAGAETPGRRSFRLQIDGEVLFRKGRVNLICGPTGCGKTSLLMALLGEMYFNPSHPTSTVYLPRDGGVSYAAQESWVINDTIKQNILFQTPYEEERYKQVIHQTGLERDLSLLDAGDETEVGEKGITLSGGQKARITLARAVYSKSEVVLLDDVLSALDVHTSKWVAEKCLGGSLLRGRTVLLVTHNVLLGEAISDYVVSIGMDGKIASHGAVREVLDNSSDPWTHAEKKVDADAVELKANAEINVDGAVSAPVPSILDETPIGKLIVAEEIALGHVSWEAAKLYLTSLGGLLFYIFLIPTFIISTFFPVLQNWFLGYWSSQYELHPTKRIPVKKYLLIYGLILLADIALQCTGQVVYILGAVRASRAIHARLVRSILSSTFRWLDTVPISRVITRCAQDCQTLDGMFPQLSLWTCYVTLTLCISFFTVIISAGWPTVPPAIVVAVIVLVCGNLYINAQLPIKRNMSNNKAPILGHMGNVLSGVVSVRAFGAQRAFREESQKLVDVYTRTARAYFYMNRWIGLRMDSIGGFFSGIVAAWLIYGRNLPAGTVGFTLTVLGTFTGALLQWIRMINETEVQANSIERILEYLEIEHEPQPEKDGKPPAYWPASGEVVVEQLSARYSVDGPLVLKDLTFHIRSGERVGVVGRTGAGKSTVALALLRTIPTEGTVLFDGLPTSSLNLSALRSNITIIPQHPELLAGTLRENLDPFGDHDDCVLNSALRASGLQGDDWCGIMLDSDVLAGGSNFSQGQRQIIALARAIVRRSKLLILDEATAAIDYETDQAIQRSIRTEFRDATVITVAHRLKTIMDSDKIMVLDAGKMAEYDTPQNLLRTGSGLFWSLVEESSDRDELYRLAGL